MKPLSIGCQSSWKIDCVVASCSLDLQKKNPETYERYCKVRMARRIILCPKPYNQPYNNFNVISRLGIHVKTDMSICLNSSIIANVAKPPMMLVLLNRMLKQVWFILAIGLTIILLTTALMTQE